MQGRKQKSISRVFSAFNPVLFPFILPFLHSPRSGPQI